MENVYIKALDVYKPQKRFITKELLDSKQLSDKHNERIGVSSIPISSDDERPTEMAEKAIRNLIRNNDITVTDVDIVIYVSATPPDFLIWSPSSSICNTFNIRGALGFEISLGCGGVQVALKTAKELLVSSKKWKKALIVSADQWGDYTNNRLSANILWGDASGAILLEKGESGRGRLMNFTGFTDGRFSDLAFYCGGTKFGESISEKYPKAKMNEYSFVNMSNVHILKDENINNYLKITNELLNESQLSIRDISFVIMPSGRKDLMNLIIEKLGVDSRKTNLSFLEHQGDLGAPGLICDLDNMYKNHEFKSGDNVLLLSAGLGISWMGSIIRM